MPVQCKKTVTCSTTVWKHQYLAHSSTFLYFVTCLYVDNYFLLLLLLCALFILQSWKFKNFRNLYQNQYYQSIPGRIWYHITVSSLCRYNSITKSGHLELSSFSPHVCWEMFWWLGLCFVLRTWMMLYALHCHWPRTLSLVYYQNGTPKKAGMHNKMLGRRRL